tara:strand:- start:11 stop:199 length:189 start_codon:yes stop_codon:yes gene_type:complete
MNITNAQYQSLKTDDVVVDAQHGIVATIDGVKMFVPIQAGNRHYDEIMHQVAAGELTIQAAD